MLHVGLALAECQIDAGIVTLAVDECRVGRGRGRPEGRQSHSRTPAAATKDAGRVTIAVTPIADGPAPSAVGSSTLVGGTEQLGVAAHPLVQRVDDLAAIIRAITGMAA